MLLHSGVADNADSFCHNCPTLRTTLRAEGSCGEFNMKSFGSFLGNHLKC